MKLTEHFTTAKCLARYRYAAFVALIAPADTSDLALETFSLELIAALEAPIELDGAAVQSRVTVGIARIPAGTGADPRGALRYAELAAREARRHGNSPVRLFSRESIVKNQRRREIIHALRGALAHQQLSLFYQPIIDISSNQVYSIEALARWEHPRLGFVSPSDFIPLAEETGLMIPLGEWVMNRACADAGSLLGPHFRRVSVNVSVAQILDAGFMNGLYQAIEKSGLDPAELELELTETVFAEDLGRVNQLLSDVRLLGVRVAIDDFGAGYSSLAYLSRLPVNVVKIDRIFVQDIDRGGEAIIAAALAVAQKLGIEVIVEGIETEQGLDRVSALGATKLQGYFFAQPMPAASLVPWHAKFISRPG
jgi:EAL domain-containing protein (putative c-di-GMP-specific phosphodiesterase class I)